MIQKCYSLFKHVSSTGCRCAVLATLNLLSWSFCELGVVAARTLDLKSSASGCVSGNQRPYGELNDSGTSSQVVDREHHRVSKHMYL